MSKLNNKLILVLAIFALFLSPLGSLFAHAQTTQRTGVEFTPDTYTGGNTSNPNPNPNPTSNLNPIIFSLNPTSITLGSGPLMVAINGNYFVPGAVAKLNGIDKSTIYVSSTYLQMQLNASDTFNPGNYFVTVYNPTTATTVGGFSNTITLNINSSQFNNPIPSSTTSTTPKTSVVTKRASISPIVPAVTKTTKSNDNDSNLSANALSSGFLPSNIIQWLIFLILALVFVVLWRKIYLNEKETETTQITQGPLTHTTTTSIVK